MPGCPPAENPLRFVVALALRKALKLVRGLRKQVTEIEEDVMAAKLIDEIGVAGYCTRRAAQRNRTRPPPWLLVYEGIAMHRVV